MLRHELSPEGEILSRVLQSSDTASPCNGGRPSPLVAARLDALLQDDLHGLASLFSDRFAYLCFDGQHVPAVTHSHEGTLKRKAINCAADFDQATGTENLDGVWPDHIGPSTLVILPQFGRKRFV